MAFEVGTATDYKDLLSKLRAFITTANTVSEATPDSGNVGNGDVSGEAADDGAPTETWTLICTVAGSGGTFSVTGSVSGAQDDATIDVPYDNGIVSFTIDEGSIAFEVGDEFVFMVTQVMGEGVWAEKRWDTDVDSSGEYELIVQGPGTGGDDEIFVGIQTYSSVGDDYYNWLLNGFTGYSAVQDFLGQPGAIEFTTTKRCPSMLLFNSTISYWFVANGRRIIVTAKVATVYESCYLGFLLSYGLPNQIPYPLVIGGTSPAKDADQMRYSSVDDYHRGFMDPAGAADGSLGTLWVLSSAWHGVSNFTSNTTQSNNYLNVWPYIMSDYYYGDILPNYEWARLTKNLDDTYPLLPCIVTGMWLSGGYYRAFFGELQGIFAIPGIGLVSEDDITVDGDTYIVFQNCHRGGRTNMWALKLE